MNPGARGPFGVAARRPVAILMVTIAAVVLGVFGWRLLAVELMPDVSYPSLTIRTEYPGAAPREVEDNVTRPIEEALGVVGALTRISSVSRAGQSDVTLEFTWGTEIGRAWQEVTERLDTVFLPENADAPLILRYDPALDAVVRLALASGREEDRGPGGLKRLRVFAEQTLERELDQVAGVAAIRVLGGLEETVAVDLDEQALRRTGVSIEDVRRRLASENVNVAGGDIAEGDTEYLVRTVGEFASLADIGEIVVSRAGGREVRIRDLGTVRSGQADREVIIRLDRGEAIAIEVQKEAEANVIDMAASVRGAIYGSEASPSGIADRLPEGWRLEVVSDRSTFIRSSIDEVRDTAILGGLLAVAVLYLFLRRARVTAVVAVAIPVSVATVFAPMHLAGLSLNIMSLGGLALGVGMLVDSSIVVVESIARCREEGDGPVDAVVRGTSEVGSAVVASTLTTIAVFFPMVFVEGVAGQVFADLALTVVFALVASLAVAVFLVPALSVERGGAPAGEGGQVAGRFARLRRAVAYRSLGPLYEEGASRPARAVARAAYALPILLAPAHPWVFGFVRDAFARLTPASSVPPWAAAARRGGFPGAGSAGGATEAATASTDVSVSGWRAAIAWIVDAAVAVKDVVLVPLAVPAGIVGLALAVVCVVALAVERFRRAGRSGAGGRRFLGFLAAPLDFFVIQFESLWLLVVWAVLAVGGVLLAVARALSILRFVLWPILRAFDALYGAVRAAYPVVLRGALRQRARVLVACGLAVVGITLLFARLDSTLIPEVHQREFDVEIALPPGTPLEQTRRLVEPIETLVIEDPRVERVLLSVGADPEADASPEEGDHTARLSVRLASVPEAEGFRGVVDAVRYAAIGGRAARFEEDVVADLRAALEGLPDLEAKISRPVLFSFRTPIEVEVEAFDLGDLAEQGERVREVLAAIPGLSDVRSTARQGNPEIQIDYDRDALARRGLAVRDVADLVRTKVQGESATEYRKRERRIDVVVRLDERDRATVRQLSNLTVNPGGAVPIPLSAVAEVNIASGPADIRRVGQRRVALVQANLVAGGLTRARDAIEARLGAMAWPDGVTWSLAGQVEEMERSLRSLWIALGLSVFLVYVVMASQFESVLHPLLVMVTVPLALVGVGVALWALSVSISVVVFLGLIMLAGIVVNNAIVWVDYANRLRARGMALEEAVVAAGSARLRPILMTTATTVLGLVPMALGLGDGSEIRTPMALTVIAGLLSSTILTLVILPTLYVSVESALAGRRARVAERTSRSEVPASGGAV